jgi:hypothetical protein
MKMDLKDGLKGVRCINLAQNRNDAGPCEIFMCMFGTPNNNNNNNKYPNVITVFIIDETTCQLLQQRVSPLLHHLRNFVGFNNNHHDYHPLKCSASAHSGGYQNIKYKHFVNIKYNL